MPDGPASRTSVGAPPPRASLLDFITATSLDEDYAHVARRREERGEGGPRRPGRSAVVAFVLFGALVATAGVQTAQSAGVEESSHENLVRQVNIGDDELENLRSDLTDLRAEELAARADNRAARSAQAGSEAEVTRIGLALGTQAISGPGLRIVANDAVGAIEDAEFVLDKDLRNIVNGLWAAGAEAVSINGERISSLTAIRFAGCCITVNYEKLSAPYVVLAVGDPDRLAARFVESTTGTYWLNAQQTFGLRFDMDVDDSLTIPAVSPDRLQLRNATSKPVEGAQ